MHVPERLDKGPTLVVEGIGNAVAGRIALQLCAAGPRPCQLQVGGSMPKRFAGLRLLALSLHAGTPVREAR